jgi:ABC-type Fe3+/spermidine/putrescine transport system ATPase subunit
MGAADARQIEPPGARQSKEYRLQGTAKPLLRLSGITKEFNAFRALDNISLDIHRGEIFSLLGPSGCGKTTTLRIIAGLEQPEAGQITLGDTVLVSTDKGIFVPSQKRNMGMVFQSYAIWPHLSVYDTVAYPLVIRKLLKDEIAKRVRRVLHQVGLAGCEDRMASMLSGGQQQRVVLARALVYEPHVLLLDEPFSNLDIKLREQMRIDLKLLQQRVGVTVILVTHDQLEALSLSDRIAVMNGGRVEQIGTPLELYDDPHSAFVRDFIGATLQLHGRVVNTDSNEATVEIDGGCLLTGRVRNGAAPKAGDAIVASIRPEKLITGARETDTFNALDATIKALLFVGDRYECVLQIGAQEVRSFLPRVRDRGAYAQGARVRLRLPPSEVVIWPR